jgi:hypothetical protein
MAVERFFEVQPDQEDRANNFDKLRGPTTRQDPEIVTRRAKLIANHLEVALALMKWFVLEATEDQRDILRQTLGTEMSFEAFNVTRVLLTEAHYEKLLKGGK